MNKFHRELHEKWIVIVDNKEYCSKCDYGYLETITDINEEK